MLQLTDICKSYRTASFTQSALDHVSITFRDSEFAAVLGPSGSGKTTLLNMIGGLDHCDSGDLAIDGVSTKKYKPSDWDTYRNNRIGFVFQSYNLIPHQTVLANVELALTLSGVSAAKRRVRAIQVLEEVGLGDHIRKRPGQLSGGQMQRVAIARALINDPEILLADEPTGALDTNTSEQVMELLTQISKDRLVIMVTHNSELADRYASRIVHLSDGQIVTDSHPYHPGEDAGRSRRVPRRARMSLLTAISLSRSNLMTKKGRTLVVALAGSIGIIGIATILAIANGVNLYIQTVERETMSLYPVTVQSSGFDLMSLFTGVGDTAQNTAQEAGQVFVRTTLSTLFSYQDKNDLTSLKQYLEESAAELAPYVNAVQYTYNITPQIYLADTSGRVDQVNPDALLSGTGTSDMDALFSFSNMSAFYELPGETRMYDYQYQLLAGHWPEGYDEAVLVLESNGSVSDVTLYAMGLQDRALLQAMMVGALSDNGETMQSAETGTEPTSFLYDTLLAVQFKVIEPAALYQYDETYHIWVDKSRDAAYLRQVVDGGTTLRIVGIVQPEPGLSVTSLSSGINYTPALVQFLMEGAADMEIVQDQLSRPEVNVLTGKTFLEENAQAEDTLFRFSDLISIDEAALWDAVTIDSARLSTDLASLTDFSLDFSDLALPDFDMEALALPDLGEITGAVAGQTGLQPEQITEGMRTLLYEFLLEEAAQGVTAPGQIAADLPAYLARSDVQEALQQYFTESLDPTLIQSQVGEALQTYLAEATQAYLPQIMDSLQAQLQTRIGQVLQHAMQQLPAALQNAVSIDTAAFAGAFELNMGEDELLSLITALMNPEERTYESTLTALGYARADTPSQISIYPLDFNAKQEILDRLDKYNDQMIANGEPGKVVHYADLIGVMMSSVTNIVNMVSYALIGFVSISLIVSSIMIGVITYISVLERKTEIGILRALGASRRDIRRVFNAEALIVGFVAGLLGILVTQLLCIPINIVVLQRFEIENIAQLPFAAAVALIGVSMFLAFIAGLIPASAAARKDPVEALRSE